MDLAADLRAAQAAYDTADRELAAARGRFDTATATYDHTRRTAAAGDAVDRARAAWALTALEWAGALIARETAKDRVALERRATDRDAADALLLPTRRTR